MRRTLAASLVVGLTLFGLSSTASAQSQPGQGVTSTGRNDAGFGGGPHCHEIVVETAEGHFDPVRVFPSHTGHAATLEAGQTIFAADFTSDPECAPE